MNTPSIDDMLTDPTTSFWLKDALRAALERDPVDASNDAALLCALLNAGADVILAIYIVR